MHSYKTFACEREYNGKTEICYVKNIGGIYCWTKSEVIREDVSVMPDKVHNLDFTDDTEQDKPPYQVIITIVPQQILVRKL